jgi:shikimate dehydrogenase
MAGSERFRMAGVMGWPVLHSRSPLLHNHWLRQHALAGVYVPLEIEVKNLAAALRALPALGFSGCNLTLPHKIEALPVVDSVDPVGARIGAINCVVVRDDGRLDGFNFDAWGFVESVAERHAAWRADAGPAVVLGAGGGARAIVDGLLQRGAKEIRVVNRTLARAEELRARFGAAIQPTAWNERDRALDGAAMLVNTTTQGMTGQASLDLALDALPKTALVCDIVYVPLETKLLAAARARGNPTVDGLGMLLHQARPAFQAWFGILPEVTPELRAAIEATL